MFKNKGSAETQNHDTLAPADVPRMLSVNDVALGMGRKATDAEMEEYLSRPPGKSYRLADAIAKIKLKLGRGDRDKG